MFGCETKIGKSPVANPDWACYLGFFNQPEVLAILKSTPQFKLYKAFRAASLFMMEKIW